ncbi:hypothetical protein [Streptomyces sp. NBC_00078]|uniref:hypothetical protein n=1 Tax=unclassified Streptomyces TaxID=2593676 RepID=UPI002256C960|nr:hypothetical protein [Streptomyces sp. NBC_00078]MCX5418290.1 hypothetical protein [Streptomyces sp. NBC_00078]
MTVSDCVPVTAGRRLYLRSGGSLPAVLIAPGGMLAAHRATLDSGTDQLAAAEGEWLLGVRLVVTALAVTTSPER